MSVIHYAIKITTDDGTGFPLAISDASIGLVSGVFRWVTDRPGYNGSISLGGDADSNVWYQGILSKQGLGSAQRRILVDSSGQYGTESSFNFQVNNTESFWVSLEAYDIFLPNRKVEFFVVIDNVFYQVWTGIIENSPFDELNFQFNCIDQFRKVHKTIPPGVINETEFPDAVDSSLGKSIPVCIGNVSKARVANASGEPNLIPTGIVDGQYIYTMAGCKDGAYPAYQVLNGGYAALQCYTPNIFFGANDLATSAGLYFIKGVKGTDQLVRIHGNTATRDNGHGQTVTTFYLESTLEDASPSTYYVDDGASHPATTSKALILNGSAGSTNIGVWYFQIIDLVVDYLISNDAVNEIPVNDHGLKSLYNYDSSRMRYQDISELVSTVDQTAAGTYSHPSISMNSNHLSLDGDYTKKTAIIPASIIGDNVGPGTIVRDDFVGSLPVLLDRSRSTSAVLSTTGSSVQTIQMYPVFPSNSIERDFSDLYLSVDMHVQCGTAFEIRFTVDSYDSSNLINYTKPVPQWRWPIVLSATASTGHFNFLPIEYYMGGGTDLDQSTYWGTSYETSGTEYKVRDKFKIDRAFIASLSDTFATSKFRFEVQIVATASTAITTTIKEVGFVVNETVNVFSDDIFTTVRGESLSGSFVESVPDTFRLIMEKYDGIHSSNIDVSEISATRGDWLVGRQLTESKSSQEYIEELCKQSFVGLVPTRLGKRKLRTWREITTSAGIDNASNILRDSIPNLNRTALADVYNDFEIRYDFDPGSNKFNRILRITNVDRPSFPGVLSNWQTYVGGVRDYTTAKYLWDLCHLSWLRTGVIAPLSKDLGDCYWYGTLSTFGITDGDSNNTALKYLINLVEWSTRQKDIAPYKLAINSTNINRELLDNYLFNDVKYTAGYTRQGWITSLQIDPSKDTLGVELILNPDDLDDITITYIDEQDATDIIDEDTATDIIDET